VDEIALVGGVLYDAPDPLAASEMLTQLVIDPTPDPDRIRELGFEPSLVQTLQRTLPHDPAAVALACARGAAWVLGRRSVTREDSWQLVASLPGDLARPPGLRRTTAETLIGLVSEANHSLRFAAPYVDTEGIGLLGDAIAAATSRGVTVEVVQPPRWLPAVSAFALLQEGIARNGQPGNLRIVQAREDAPWAHLKVVIVDGTAAYIGSANITGAGLAGRNLEVGVLVRGPQVAVINGVLDLYI
jgi:phosphatidylserine/phosphatidylglycerophosphate/cardiolipin synthase-like enzyme